MRYKPLGSFSRVSEVGMGTYYDPAWLVASRALGIKQGAASKVEAIKAGLDGGMNLIDTAEIYGSEPLVAEAIRGRKRDELFIATKVWPSHLRRDALVRALEGSLARLGTSYVDLYMAHWPNPRVPIAETMSAMEELKANGKVNAIGVSNFSLAQMMEADGALKNSRLASNEVDYSLVHRNIEADILPYCEANHISILGYYPLGHGKLARGAGGRMEQVCKEYSKTPAQVALGWLVSRENVFAIPRASRAEHVVENTGGSGWELRPEDRGRLEALFPA